MTICGCMIRRCHSDHKAKRNRTTRMKLADKFAVITGASQGLGLAIAHRFVQEGATVLLCARTASDLKTAAGQVRAKAAPGVRILTEAADVSSTEEVDRLAEIAHRQLGKVDILVSNAGVIGPKGATEQVDWVDWSRTISINLLGTVLCCRAFLPMLRQSQHGKIV